MPDPPIRSAYQTEVSQPAVKKFKLTVKEGIKCYVVIRDWSGNFIKKLHCSLLGVECERDSLNV
jgi:hypothetical protein